MHDVNWWLMALAFLLGMLLTLALTIRKVTREVPVTHAVSAGIRGAGVPKPHLDKPDLGKAAGVAGAAATLHGAADKAQKKVEKTVEKVEKTVAGKAAEVDKKITAKAAEVDKKITAKAAEVDKKVDRVERTVVGKAEHVEDILEKEPYGAGSIRVSARTEAPAGYVIKGDKDTGRYFTLDSPDYEAVEAEVWFANEESAEKAGFLRWDAKGGHTHGLLSADSAAVITEKHEAADTIITENVSDSDSTLVVVQGGSAGSSAAAGVVSAAAGTAKPYGEGSAKAGNDGIGPAGWLIKGNEDSMLFHGPDSPYYEQTIAEVWFVDEATARAAGFDKWDKNLK